MILVTGCTGYLGFHICEYLKTKKIPFYGIDNFSRSSQKNIIDKEKFYITKDNHKIEFTDIKIYENLPLIFGKYKKLFVFFAHLIQQS